MRPEIDARIVQKPSCTFKFSSCARFDSAVAFEMLTCVCALLSVTIGVAFLADEIGVALDVALRLLERGLRAVDHGLDALHVGFDLAAIEREKLIAFFDARAVEETNAGDRGVDLRLDGDSGDGGHGAQGPELHRHRLALGGGGLHRHRAGLRLRARRNAVGRPQTADEHDDAEQGQRRPSDEPLSLKHR